jgi:hypothetical protein
VQQIPRGVEEEVVEETLAMSSNCISVKGEHALVMKEKI